SRKTSDGLGNVQKNFGRQVVGRGAIEQPPLAIAMDPREVPVVESGKSFALGLRLLNELVAVGLVVRRRDRHDTWINAREPLGVTGVWVICLCHRAVGRRRKSRPRAIRWHATPMLAQSMGFARSIYSLRRRRIQ